MYLLSYIASMVSCPHSALISDALIHEQTTTYTICLFGEHYLELCYANRSTVGPKDEECPCTVHNCAPDSLLHMKSGPS